MHTGIIVLAAGNSSRLGAPKQLLPIGNSNLLLHTISKAKQAGLAPIVVVYGAYAEAIQPVLPGDIIPVFNANWSDGMGSSIACGMQYLLHKFPTLPAVIVSVCDQPFIDPAIYQQLIGQQLKSGKGIVASSYNNIAGVPVLFTAQYFDTLAKFTGNHGAKALLAEQQPDLATVDFEKGKIDIDTPADAAEAGNFKV